MTVKLRPYQQQAIESTRDLIRKGKKRFVLCSPTGSGKTFTFSFIVKSAYTRGKRILILTHRTELLTQAGGALTELGLIPVKIEAGRKLTGFHGNLYTAMIETISRRMGNPEYQKFIESLDLIIIDECHFGNFDKFFQHLSDKSHVIGFTATPHREKNQKSLDTMYQDLIEVISIPELVDQGYLSEPLSYGVTMDLSSVKIRGGDYDSDSMGDFFQKQKVFNGVIENYKKICPGTKSIVFTPNIASSKNLRDELIGAGLNARHLDSNMSSSERGEILEWFRRTADAMLCNVGILTTGFDEPSIETVILYRATKSLPLFLQMVGRGSRVITGRKHHFNILDFGNNILTHGFWHEPRTWTLDQDREERPIGAPMVKNCDECEAFIPIQAIVCPECGHVHEKAKHEQETARLQLLDPREARMEADRGDLTKKAALCRAGVVKAHYVLHNLRSFEDVKKFVDMMGYSPWWYQYNHNRFWWSDNYLEEVRTGSRGLKKQLI